MKVRLPLIRRKPMKTMDIQLSAIWILASTDGQRIISYPGLYYRLTEKASFEKIESLSNITDKKRYIELCDLVKGWRELFRTVVPETQLEEWKGDLKDYKEIKAETYPT